ncbi:hypothetical protein D3C76_1553070 [compost metagenome]
MEHWITRINGGPGMGWQHQQSVLHIVCKDIQYGIRPTFDLTHTFHGRVNKQRTSSVNTKLVELLKQALLCMHNESITSFGLL